jgi:tRNA (guanine-N7-)-methyltransferase
LKVNADIYGSECTDELLFIKTHYEQLFLKQGLPITYLRFRIDGEQVLVELSD